MLTRTLYLAALLGTALVDAAPPLVTVPTRVCTVGSAQFSWDRTQLPAYSGNIWRV
jgi:hypothetical protein